MGFDKNNTYTKQLFEIIEKLDFDKNIRISITSKLLILEKVISSLPEEKPILLGVVGLCGGLSNFIASEIVLMESFYGTEQVKELSDKFFIEFAKIYVLARKIDKMLDPFKLSLAPIGRQQIYKLGEKIEPPLDKDLWQEIKTWLIEPDMIGISFDKTRNTSRTTE